MNPLEMAQKIAALLDDKQAKDVKVIHVSELTTLCRYFVIAHGTNSTQVKTLADYVETEMLEYKESTPLLRREGYRSSSWVLMDYGDVIVHVFYKETREFYDLEHLWADGEEIPLLTRDVEGDK